MSKVAEIITQTVQIPGTELTVTFNPDTIKMSLLVSAILLLLTFVVRRVLKQTPGRLQSLVEFLLSSFENMLTDSMGPEGRKFLPLVLTLFLFILFSNWLTIIPGLEAPTRDLNTCLGLGVLVFLISHGAAIQKKGLKKYLQGYFRPFWFLFPSNVFSEIGKLLSHSFRLFGNIFAGGVVIALVPIILLKALKWWGVPIDLIFMPVLNAFFGLFLGSIQAFVFSLLAVAYISILREE